MTGKGPTDFNDQGADDEALAAQLREDIAALDVTPETKTPNTDIVAKLFKGKVHNSGGDKLMPIASVDEHERWQDLYETNKGGDPVGSVFNVALVFQCDERWQGVLGYCDFSYKIIKRKAPPMPGCEAGEWEDSDTAALRVWFANHFGFTPNDKDIADSLIVTAKANRFHPVRNYLEPLRWDGQPRLESWLVNGLGCSDNETYLSLIGKRFLIGAVARVMNPGCKMDNVLILEGIQGKGKSTTVRCLFGGEWFSDATLNIGDKDAYQLIQGVWGFEVAELDSFNKADTTTLKQFFSTAQDRFRPPYGRNVQDWPRQTVFMGTTNNDTYLRDYSGNRRFWPAYCSRIDLDWVRANRDQLWAEALQLYAEGVSSGHRDQRYKYWVDESDPEFPVVKEAQDDRLQRDPWEDIIDEWLQGRFDKTFATREILQDAIKMDAPHIQQAHENRVGPIMRSLGWKVKRVDMPVKIGEKRRQRRRWTYVGDGSRENTQERPPL